MPSDEGKSTGQSRPAPGQHFTEPDPHRTEARHEESLAETGLIPRTRHRSVITPRVLVQAVVAGVICAGLLAAWIIEYFYPILQARREVSDAKQEAMLWRQEAESQEMRVNKAKYDEDVSNLRREKERVESEKIQLRDQSGLLAKEYDTLRIRYAKSEEEKTRYKSLADSATARFERLASGDLPPKSVPARDVIEQHTPISALTHAIGGSTVRIRYTARRALEARRTADRLRSFAAEVDLDSLPDSRGWLFHARKIHYYNSARMDAANAMAVLLNDIDSFSVVGLLKSRGFVSPLILKWLSPDDPVWDHVEDSPDPGWDIDIWVVPSTDLETTPVSKEREPSL